MTNSENRVYRPRRLLVNSDAVNRVLSGNQIIFIEPVKWKHDTIADVWDQYQEKPSGSPWGKPHFVLPDRVYSCEKIVRTDDDQAAYEDGDIALNIWSPKWSRSSLRAFYQPADLARFHAEIDDVDIAKLNDIPFQDILLTGIPVADFGKLWDEQHGQKYPVHSNPTCWVIRLKNIEKGPIK